MRGARSAPLCAGLMALALAGCVTAPRRPVRIISWPQRRVRLQALDSFALAGRVAVAAAGRGFDAHLEWRQHGVRTRVDLSGPLGIGGVEVIANGQSLDVRTSRGRKLTSAEARARLAATLGFEPPLQSFRYWVLGVPDPGGASTETLDSRHRVTAMQQRGWQITYLGYMVADGYWLPRRMNLSRAGVRVRLFIDHWQP